MLAAREGDLHSGHATYAPGVLGTGSPDVNIEGKPASREGDSTQPHNNLVVPFDPHICKIAKGSGTVNINGKPAARIFDKLDGGGSIVSGNSTVLIGG